MKRIHLKDEYDWYPAGEYIEVSDEVAAVFEESNKAEEKHRIKAIRYRAIYSLDAGDGIEKEVLFVVMTPEELYERKLTMQELYKALHMLPEIQFKRIVAYFFQDMKMAEIADIEGVSTNAVSKTIDKGLKNLEKILKGGLKNR